MQVEVKLFAIARQHVGSDVARVELPSGATVQMLREQLASDYPALAGSLSHMRFAVDNDYASDDTRLHETAEVACIPPVSGG